MNIVFMGTPQFSVPSLKSLINSKHNIQAVVTQPDRPKGRSKKLVESPVKKLAVENNLTVLQPERLNIDESAISLLEQLDIDLIVTAAFGQILSDKVLSIPKIDCINIHTSLLPKYRGAAPINRALINGDEETGITIMRMSKGMDEGDIIDQKVVNILNDENAEELEERLANLSVDGLLNVIEFFEKGTVKYIKQDDSKVTFADKLEKSEGLIDWSCSSKTIHDLIRGLIPWPCAFSYFNKADSDDKKRIIIKKSFIDDECKNKNNTSPGTVNKISDKGLLVSTNDGSLWIELLQPEGKRTMNAKDYINGHGVKIGDYFST